MNVFQSTMEWIKQPFAEPLDLFHLFLVIGIVLVMLMAWNLILYQVRVVAEEVV